MQMKISVSSAPVNEFSTIDIRAEISVGEVSTHLGQKLKGFIKKELNKTNYSIQAS